MSGDVQPRKRNKDKRSKKKDDDLDLEETNIHVHKDVKFGGNVVSKIFFSLVFGALICMVGVIVFEHRGMGNEVLSSSESPWSQMLEGWVEDKDSHDSHDHHVTHDDHDEEEEDDHTEDVSGEHDDHDDEHTEDLSGEDNHDDDDHNEHDDEAEDYHDPHSEEQSDDTDEESSSYFTRFMQSYVQSSDGEKENDNADEHDDDVNNDLEEEASVFTGFINKYIYTTESAKDREDEGYDTQDDDDNDVDDENSKEINDYEDKYREDDDDSELDNDEENNDRDDETPDDVDDDIEYKTSSRRYSFQDEKDDDENNDDDLENDDDDDVSREADNDLDSKEQVVEDWRKIVYRSPAHHEEEEDGDDEVPYESHTPARVDREEKNESEEQNGDDDDDVEARDELEDNALPDDDDDVEARDDLEDNALPDDDDDSEADVNEDDNEPAVDEQDTNAEEDEGAGIAVKFTVGVALIVVAHLVLVKKWKGDADIIAPSAPQPPLAQDPPAYIEQIPLLSSLEEEDIPPPYIPADRRATLVEPGEVVLSPSDVEESDLGEYEEEMSGSDVELEPPRESTLVTYEYSPVDTEQEEEEEEEEEKSENDISAPINDKWAARPRPTPQMDSNSENEELVDTEDEIEFSDHEPSPTPAPVPQARYGGPKSGEEDYLLADITSAQDWGIRNELDAAEAMYNGSKVEQALRSFEALTSSHPHSPRSLHGVAKCLDAMAEVKKSNSLLEAAIEGYLTLLTRGEDIPEALLISAAQRCIDRGRFKGNYQKIIPAHQHLINRFPDNPKYRNDLAVTYLTMARNTPARAVLEDILTKWPEDGLAHANLGFILKSEGRHESAVEHLVRGIHTGDFSNAIEVKNRGKYYYVLGDALQRLGRYEEAHQIYSEAADQGMFKSAYQRSIHNVDRLTARPWWNISETTYLPFFSKLERNWKKIRDEALAILKMKDKTGGFQDEAETLVQSGDWKQFDLFMRGRRVESNCKRTPSTCKLISEFPPASNCVRGQVKFSVIHPGTHVWPHCGPTNCRLRAHLGLVVPENTALRVANETRTWEEGKVLLFDDSFEHEVWHNGTSYRLVLLVDVWHPELTASERNALKPI